MTPSDLLPIVRLHRGRERRAAEQLSQCRRKASDAAAAQEQVRRAQHIFESVRATRQAELYGALSARRCTPYELESLNAKLAGMAAASDQFRDHLKKASARLQEANEATEQARARHATHVRDAARWSEATAELAARERQRAAIADEAEQDELANELHHLARRREPTP